MTDSPPTAAPSASSSASPGDSAASSATDAGRDGTPDGCLFDAILTPHRSLSPTGFLVLMSLVALVGFGIGIAFLTIGAWPVFGFCGLEVFLIWLCFRLSYRSARMWERIRLTPGALVVERHMVDGAWREWTFQPYWLRVLMDDPPQHESRLVLTSHGESVAIGSFLTPEERLDLAKALRRALAAARETPAAG
jgi:uncharacterized membrane protein